MVFVYISKGRKKGRKEKKVGAAEPLRENEPPSEQRGREGPYLSSGTLGRLSRQGAGRDEGASGSRKCQKEGEPFQGEDAGGVGVGKKRKTKSVGGKYRALQSAGELSRAVETGKNK